MGMLEAFGIKEAEGRYSEEAIYSLALIYNHIDDRMSSYLARHNLTPGKFNILMVTKHLGKSQGISQVEISKRLIVTASNMTKLINKLEQDNLVVRHGLAADRRVNVMKITPKGSRLLDQVWEGYSRNMKIFMKRVPLDKQKLISSLLKEWLVKL